MALTVRWCNPDLTTGANDGTSEANAWQSLSACASGVAANTLVNCKRTASRHSESLVTFADASSSGPIVLRGYRTTAGDYIDVEDHSNDFWISSRVIIGTGFYVLGCDWEGNPGADNLLLVTPEFASGQPGGIARYYRCRFYNTRNASTQGSLNLNDEGTAIDCDIKAPTNSFAVRVVDSGLLHGCRVDMTNTGADGVRIVANVAEYQMVVRNQIRGAGTGRGIFSLTFDDNILTKTRWIDSNSIYNVANAIELAGVSTTTKQTLDHIINNVMWNVSTGIRNLNGTSGSAIMIRNNAISSTASPRYAGFNDQLVLEDISLTANPFADPDNWDFALNNDAGGGALLRQAAIITDPVHDGSNQNLAHLGALQKLAAIAAETGTRGIRVEGVVIK